MRTRKVIKATKVVTASHTGVVKHTNPNSFREGKIRAYLSELGINVREYTRMSAIRHDMRMLNLNIN